MAKFPEDGGKVPGSKGSAATVTSTEAQNNFGRVLARVGAEGRVFITKYERPAAVLLSLEAYASLTGKDRIDLPSLEREFDEMFARMQEPGQRQGIDRFFAMTGSELGAAALRGARSKE